MYRGVIKIVLIAVPVLLLVGLFVAGLMRWREDANRLRCQDNLRRVGWFALWQFTDKDFAFPEGKIDFGNRTDVLRGDALPPPDRAFPAGTVSHPTLPPTERLAWTVTLLPYLGREELHNQFDLTQGWNAPANRDAILARVPVLACPSQYQRPPEGHPQLFPYPGMAGVGADAPMLPPTDPRAGFLRYDHPTTTGMVTRGFSHTITVLETGRDLGPWAAGGPPTVRPLVPSEAPYIGLGRPFGGHAGGANAAFADGSVRFIDDSISPSVLEMMATLATR